jgi:hypothetical protein
MFQLLRKTMLSYVGGEGVDGGQGLSDYIYGDVDKSERYGDKSEMADEENRDFHTGELYDP